MGFDGRVLGFCILCDTCRWCPCPRPWHSQNKPRETVIFWIQCSHSGYTGALQSDTQKTCTQHYTEVKISWRSVLNRLNLSNTVKSSSTFCPGCKSPRGMSGIRAGWESSHTSVPFSVIWVDCVRLASWPNWNNKNKHDFLREINTFQQGHIKSIKIDSQEQIYVK